MNKHKQLKHMEQYQQTPSDTANKLKYKQTQKTISQLKQSIDSIERMIEKSQVILRNTKPLHPREVRSDSIELKLQFDSRSKSNHNHRNRVDELDKLSATAVTRNNTNPNTTLQTQNNHNDKHILYPTKLPQKTKPIRPYLFIDIDNLNASDGEKSERSKIFINQTVSPISAATKQKEGFQESFVDSLQSPFTQGKRFKTEAINDSYQSLQRYSSIQIKSDSKTIRQEQIPIKKIVLRKKKFPNHNHLRTISQLQREATKPRKNCIFEPQKNKQKVKKGKYSYFQPNPQICVSREQVRQKIVRERGQEQRSPWKISWDSDYKKQHCLKFNKQNDNSEMQQFYRKVRQFGFVQRYLTFNQIGCIFEYLRKSSIPQHKWPLYVVDKVYEKMQGISRVKI